MIEYGMIVGVVTAWVAAAHTSLIDKIAEVGDVILEALDLN